MGMVYLVGAGPGNPELITLKGFNLLKTCDVVIYDRLASYELLEYVKDDCIKIYVGKASGQHSKTQEEINQIILEKSVKYQNVVRLKGGDPFVFGRGGEEIQVLLENDIPFEVVPGVTSAISVPELSGIPVTHRGISQSFHVITGHTASNASTLTENYEALAKLQGTLVFLMGLSNLSEIIWQLVANGMNPETPIAVISNGSMSNEKKVKGILKDIVDKVNQSHVESPAIIVIGNTVNLDFTSPSKKPLSNISFGVIATKELHDKLRNGIKSLGGRTLSVCNMEVVEMSGIYELRNEFTQFGRYQWIIFTSQNAIRIFYNQMELEKIDRRVLSHLKFAVIGNGTAKTLENYGYFADFIPTQFDSSSLANELSDKISVNDRLLIPRACRGSRKLTEIFDQRKISYKEILTYDVKGKLTDNRSKLWDLDCLIFVSESGVISFLEETRRNGIQVPPDIKIACIGDITAKVLEQNGLPAHIVATTADTDGLITAIRSFSW